jgi:regulator of cell morphogenesis and NO signaling
MYQTHKTYIKPGMKMLELINENPFLLLMLEHLDIDVSVDDKSVALICMENNIGQAEFLLLANLYNGFYPDDESLDKIEDVGLILRFLKNSHNFYKNDKYPEIRELIRKLQQKHNNKDIRLIEEFFSDYFEEVLEHLNYEDEVAFPHFHHLIGNAEASSSGNYCANDYREHHTDIETKLTDLKNLLLKHISFNNDLTNRRKFLFSLFELEFDLNIHVLIEEKVLLPVVDRIEKNRRHG